MSSNASQHNSAIKVVIGANIRAARARKRLLQRELAEQLDTDVMQVSRWERAVTRPGAHYENLLAELLFDGDVSALYAEPKAVA